MDTKEKHHILLFGITGGTGKQIAVQLLDLGYRITAIVRDPAKVKVQSPQLQLKQTCFQELLSNLRSTHNPDILFSGGNFRFC